MCDPVSMAVTSFIVGAGSSVMQYTAASNQAREQDRYYEQNRVNAINAANVEHQSLALRSIQEDQATGAKRFDNMLETKAKAAKAAAGAGEAGITGLSVEGLVNDVFMAGGRTNERIATNHEMTLQQINTEKAGVNARMDDRINSVRKGTKPSALALGLNIASAGVDGFTKYKAFSK